MHAPTPSLSPEQRARIVANLDECLALYDQRTGLLTVDELRAKSLLSVLRDEISGKSAILTAHFNRPLFPKPGPT